MRPLSITLSILIGVSACAPLDPQREYQLIQTRAAEDLQSELVWHRLDSSSKKKVEALLAGPLDPSTAATVAVLLSPQIQLALENLGIRHLELVQAGLPENPILEGEIKLGSGGTAIDVALLQNIFSLLAIPRRTEIAEVALEAERLTVLRSVVNVQAAARAQVFSLQGANELERIEAATRQSAEASALLATRLYEAGNIPHLDLLHAQATAVQARANHLRAIVDRQRQATLLNKLLGLPKVDLNVTPLDPRHFSTLERSEFNDAVARNLGLQVLDQKLLQLGKERGLSRPEALLSEFALGGVGDRESDGSWTGGPTFEFPLPLFDLGGTYRAETTARLEAARIEMLAARNILHAELEAALAEEETLSNQAAIYRNELLPLNRSIYKESLAHYNAMDISVFQLFQARDQLVATERSTVQAELSYLQIRNQLEAVRAGGDFMQIQPSLEQPQSITGAKGH